MGHKGILEHTRVFIFTFAIAGVSVFFGGVSSAFADCANPAGDEGTIIYNSAFNVPQVCTGTTWMAMGELNPSAGGSGCSNPTGDEGDIIYNGDHHVLQYCDGDDWKAAHGKNSTGCAAPTLCPNIGDVCDDSNGGTTNDPLFAGFMLYPATNTCEALFVTNNNQSTSSQWKTSTGTNDIATDSTEDGRINDGQVADSATFPAFKLCKDLTDGGFTDWHLPARDELHLLWKNKSAIDANAAGSFAASSYWSSTEQSSAKGWNQNLSTGTHANNDDKNLLRHVRCVRRD